MENRVSIPVEHLIRLPSEEPWSAHPVLVYLDQLHGWDIGQYSPEDFPENNGWNSRTFGGAYPILFWINLPVSGVIRGLLKPDRSTVEVADCREALAQAFQARPAFSSSL